MASCRVGSTKGSSACMGPMKEVTIIFTTSSIVRLQVNNREGTQPQPSTENWIKNLLGMALPIRTRPNFPSSQSLPSESFHEPLILISQGTDKNHNHRKLTNKITWTTALSNSMKLGATLCRATQDGQVMVESSDKTSSTGEGKANHFSILALRTP